MSACSFQWNFVGCDNSQPENFSRIFSRSRCHVLLHCNENQFNKSGNGEGEKRSSVACWQPHVCKWIFAKASNLIRLRIMFNGQNWKALCRISRYFNYFFFTLWTQDLKPRHLFHTIDLDSEDVKRYKHLSSIIATKKKILSFFPFYHFEMCLQVRTMQ